MGSESLIERLRPDSASMQERVAGNSHQGKGVATKSDSQGNTEPGKCQPFYNER